MGLFQVIDHPLIQHKLAIIRDKNTPNKIFREALNEVGMLLAYEVTKNLPLKEVTIETPLTKIKQQQLAKDIALIPILRAGLGLLDGFLKVLPTAKVGHIGMKRNEETLKPTKYLLKLPQNILNQEVFVLDPMLATGGSAVLAVDMLKKRGIKNITFVCLVAAPQGLHLLQQNYPNLNIFAAALDERLNEYGYIVPGLGDAGDRLFGTQ